MAEAWLASPEIIEQAEVTRLIRQVGLADYDALYGFSIEKPDAYWCEANRFLNIK